MPIGVPSSVASVTIASEPKIALARPPLSAWGGGVISVKSDKASPPMPSRKVSIRIQTSQKMPNDIAASASVSATTLTRLRRACRRQARALARSREASRAALTSMIPSRFFSWRRKSLEIDSTTKVIMNSTSPR